MSSATDGRYNFPVTDDYAAQIHTVAGVKSLSKESNLMHLLHNLEEDGNEVSGAVIELIALLNYVSCTTTQLSDLETHLTYCLNKVYEHR
jgi:hypothetical protein